MLLRWNLLVSQFVYFLICPLDSFTSLIGYPKFPKCIYDVYMQYIVLCLSLSVYMHWLVQLLLRPRFTGLTPASIVWTCLPTTLTRICLRNSCSPLKKEGHLALSDISSSVHRNTTETPVVFLYCGIMLYSYGTVTTSMFCIINNHYSQFASAIPLSSIIILNIHLLQMYKFIYFCLLNNFLLYCKVLLFFCDVYCE